MYGPEDITSALARWRYVGVRVNTRLPHVRLPAYSTRNVTLQTLCRSMNVSCFASGVAFYVGSDCYWIPWLAILAIEEFTPTSSRPPPVPRVRRKLRLIKGGQ